MNRYLFSILALCAFFCANSQTFQDGTDREYLEDQFYIGLGYNILRDKPENVGQRSLSYSLQVGFIKDIPLNQRRNFGLGLGIGYATNSYYSNLVANRANGATTYQIGNIQDLKRSKFETHAVEFPLELRWRTSTAADYKFWRIYAGAKLGYVFLGRSRWVTDTSASAFTNGDIQKLQYGLTLNFGYNTWNVQTYYGLNPLLHSGTNLENGSPINLQVLRIGVIFYIL